MVEFFMIDEHMRRTTFIGIRLLVFIFLLKAMPSIAGTSEFVFEDHGYVNPFTGGVAWETANHVDVLSMEWAFVGLSDVLPRCSGAFDWSSVDDFLARVVTRGHQGILRPVVFGPGYIEENYAPSDLVTNAFVYEGSVYDNPDWSDESVQTCVLKFIDAFAERYKNDQRIAYIQMGLVGLWGEHHLDGGPYTASNFPSFAFQKTMVEHYLRGFGRTSSDLLTGLSLDSAQSHGYFSSDDVSLDNERIGFFDDSLLTVYHNDPNNWRQQTAPAIQLELRKQYGWGGEAFYSGCNSTGSWAIPPNDCGNGETLGDQAQRVGLNYMLGSPAFTGNTIPAATLLSASQLMGYKFTATAAARLDDDHIQITIENTGVAYCPYKVEVCTAQGCAGNLATLAPGSNVSVTVPASAAGLQTLFFSSPRLDPNSSTKIRWSNVGADGDTATLMVNVSAVERMFLDSFEAN